MKNATQPVKHCPVSALNDEMMPLLGVYSREKQGSDAAYQKIDCLSKYASYLRAKSAKGALLHIGLIRANMDMLHNRLLVLCNESQTSQTTEVEAQELYDGADRMLWSLVECLELMSGERIENACGKLFMNRHLNPHTLLDTALSA